MLKDLGIIIGHNTKAGNIFAQLFPNFMEINYSKPSEYVTIYWSTYKKSKFDNSINGKIFEYILATLCIRENILPLYLRAKVAFVPNVIYDLMFYTAERGPICWSVKTSLRERYKQADLEAIALKYVHRKALSYLITLDEKEAISVKKKIFTGDIIGLDDIIIATKPDFDKFISEIKKFKFIEPPTVQVIKTSQVVTIEKVKSVLS